MQDRQLRPQSQVQLRQCMGRYHAARRRMLWLVRLLFVFCVATSEMCPRVQQQTLLRPSYILHLRTPCCTYRWLFATDLGCACVVVSPAQNNGVSPAQNNGVSPVQNNYSCTYGCCNRCSCSTSSAGDGMGPTTCSCPLARNWDRGNSMSCPGWWYDNAGPLDPVGIHPNGHGGIPDIQDTPGNLLV